MIRKDKTPQADNLVCDFTGGAVAHRFRFGGGRGQARRARARERGAGRQEEHGQTAARSGPRRGARREW